MGTRLEDDDDAGKSAYLAGSMPRQVHHYKVTSKQVLWTKRVNATSDCLEVELCCIILT